MIINNKNNKKKKDTQEYVQDAPGGYQLRESFLNFFSFLSLIIFENSSVCF